MSTVSDGVTPSPKGKWGGGGAGSAPSESATAGHTAEEKKDNG